MSDQSISPSEYLNGVLANFNDALSARHFGAALVWAETAAVLDSESDHSDPTTPVNSALFQLVFDTVLNSEYLVLKCGNVTTTHGDWLSYGQQANDLLVSRLNRTTPEAIRALTAVLQGHFNTLFEALDQHFDRDALYTVTTGEEAKLLLNSTSTMRKLIAAQVSLQINKDVDFANLATLLQICVESPDYLILRFPLRFLNSWDKALFFIEGAQGVLAEMKAAPVFSTKLLVGKDALVTGLDAALEQARALTSAKSKLAKASFRRMRDLGKQIAAACAR